MAVTAATAGGQILLETNNVDRVNFQRGDQISMRDRGNLALMAYYDRKGTQKASRTDLIKLFRGELMDRVFQITDAVVVGATAGNTAANVTTDTTAGLVVGMICLVFNDADATEGATAGTLISIDAISAGVDVDMTNLSGGTVANGDAFTPIGYASAEDATTGPAYFDLEPETITGYLTTLKLKVQLTITERDSEVYAATSREKEKIDRSRMEFMRHREANAWFSRATTNVGSNKVRTSMGIHEQIVNGTDVNLVDASAAALDNTDLANAIADGAKYYQSTNFAVFHGSKGLSGLFKLGAGKLETKFTESVYGFKAQEISVAQYTMSMVHSQLFDVVGLPFNSIMVGVDLASTENWFHANNGRMRLIENTDPKAEKEGETVSHMWRVKEGISIVDPTRHWLIENLA